MMTNKSKLIGLILIVLAFITVSAALNYGSFAFAKKACTDNNKTPMVETGLLAFNWSVSCK
ncbi:hypothetical protein AS034_01430 [[Bacillus] enclensis]|uniref:Uncharacterized protein n=1 Tax=[Bacillus] enclensis TaxID=1402860 RepID=A0A0V8HPJ6_9BACI|nr:hypothetical protein AS034_01430 [[Bacillus] enclensis]SCB75581.1 hypothetical protein GA0061094_0296 [[Bacillus] enclensis]